MGDVNIQHDFDCDQDSFWRLFFDPEFNREQYVGRLRFSRRDQLEFVESETTVTQRVLFTPPLDGLPSALKAVIGDSISYEEFGELDRATRVYTLQVKPGKMADKIDIRGTIRTSALPDGRTRRVLQVTVKANIFMVGGMLEEKILTDLKKSYAENAAFAAEWLKRG